ncbi:MAG: IS1380 family transposase [Acidimicrobiales bacterium]
MVLGEADPTLTPRAGLKLVAEVDRIVCVADTLDSHIGPIKSRNRGLSAGELVLSLAETMLGGGDFLNDLDHQRVDEAGRAVRAVPEIPASTTVIGLAKGFGPEVFAGIEAGMGSLVRRWWAALPEERRTKLSATRPTIDLDPTDVEVYGRLKRGVAHNHQGQLCGRPHPAVWAEAGVVLAGVLGSGVDDPRPQAPRLIATAVGALPCGLGRPIIRGDSGFFDAKVARAALAAGADYAIAAKRNPAAWRAMRDIPTDAWVSARGMDATVAECDYLPAGWPPATRCIVRRVRVDAAELSHDSRSRRRRTIDPEQLALLEAGEIGHAYAYSFILTNLAGEAVDIEAWFRQRALVEERIKDTKLGAALRHLPSGYAEVNTLWMWSAFLALNLSVFTQSLAGVDAEGRAHGKRLRRELICVVARVLSHARQVVLRLAPEDRHGIFADAWDVLVAIPALPGP